MPKDPSSDELGEEILEFKLWGISTNNYWYMHFSEDFNKVVI
jgi:hypothetical protein